MAIPSYTTDLTTLATGDLNVDAGTWDESSDAAWDDAGAMVDDQNLYYNNTECVSAQFTKDGIGTIIYGHGTGITIPTDGAVLMWHMWAAPPALSTKANGGVRILVGDGFGAFEGWIVSGSDFPPEFIWNNHAINPNIGSPDYTVGTPTIYSYFGTAVNALAQARGNPNAMNAVRYGRCEQIYTGGETANYAIFSGYAAVDNAGTAKYALLRNISGGYLFQGLMSLGSTGTLVDFRDANVNISIADTENVSANFNKIEINNAGSNVAWSAISISALGTTSKGKFEVVDNATVLKEACTFTDMDTFIYQSNSTINGSTFRRTGQVTLGGATINGTVFADSTAAISLACGASISTISDCDFESDGSNHAMEITSGTSHTLDNISFTGYETYSAGGTSTGNEAVFVNIGAGDVTLYADAQFSYRTAGANVSIVAGAVDATITSIAVDGSAVDNVSVGLFAKDATGDLPYKESISISNSGTTATVTHTSHGMITNDKVLIEGGDQPYNRGVFLINVTNVNTYTYTTNTAPSGDPAGCTATWTSIYEVLSGTNTITKSRTFSNPQPVSGWARRSTSSPLYKTAPVTGTISTTLGVNLTALMLSDE